MNGQPNPPTWRTTRRILTFESASYAPSATPAGTCCCATSHVPSGGPCCGEGRCLKWIFMRFFPHYGSRKSPIEIGGRKETFLGRSVLRQQHLRPRSKRRSDLPAAGSASTTLPLNLVESRQLGRQQKPIGPSEGGRHLLGLGLPTRYLVRPTKATITAANLAALRLGIGGGRRTSNGFPSCRMPRGSRTVRSPLDKRRWLFLQHSTECGGPPDGLVDEVEPFRGPILLGRHSAKQNGTTFNWREDLPGRVSKPLTTLLDGRRSS